MATTMPRLSAESPESRKAKTRRCGSNRVGPILPREPQASSRRSSTENSKREAKGEPSSLGGKDRGSPVPGPPCLVFPKGARCNWRGAMPGEYTRLTEQAQGEILARQNGGDIVSNWRQIKPRKGKGRCRT